MPVIVVVEKGDAAAHGLRQQAFAIGAGAMLEVDAGFGGNVGEGHGRRGNRRRLGQLWSCLHGFR